jgi:triacylglycerol lipase
MEKLGRHLQEKGYEVHNIGYPSTRHPIEKLAKDLREGELAPLAERDDLCFVTHSMGGIILRWIESYMPMPGLFRAVMLGPPNQGSEVADHMKHYRLARWLNGPALNQLGTDAHSVPLDLDEINFHCGVLAGSKSSNPFFRRFFDEANDGKVAVESTKDPGVNDWRVLPVFHSNMMKNRAVINHVTHFLQHGWFEKTH